jgi:pyruvate/2-oxoglutarate dehydrogenase complex dihydrolipoamide acyltransferase (E2) component
LFERLQREAQHRDRQRGDAQNPAEVVQLNAVVVPRLLMPLSITYDHRIVDGAAAARFLNDVKNLLGAPGRLLLAP